MMINTILRRVALLALATMAVVAAAEAQRRQTPKGTYHRACVTGDPHVTSFDGVSWDCHGVGEFVIFRSTQQSQRRQVQGRMTRMGTRDVSLLHAIAVQDEASTSPKVQFSIPIESRSSLFGTELGDEQCVLDFFVNETEYNLADGYEDDEILVTVHGNYNEVRLKYKQTGFWVKLRMGYYKGCLLQTCYYIPDTDNVIGLLGTPDNDATNDWVTRDGVKQLIPEERLDRVGQAAYDFCTTNWCMRDHMESIFHYNEIDFGYGFDYYNRCDLDYGETLAEFIEGVDETIVTACEKELACMMDALEGGLDFALEGVQIQKSSLGGTCFPEGGTCEVGATCCDGLECVESGIERICQKKTLEVATCVVSTVCLLIIITSFRYPRILFDDD